MHLSLIFVKVRPYAYIVLIGLLLCFSKSHAQWSITTSGVAQTINFDATVSGVNNNQFRGTGLYPSPSATRLDSDAWLFLLAAGSSSSPDNSVYGGSYNPGSNFALGQSTGNVSQGGIYSFILPGGNGRGLGLQPSGSIATPGFIELKVTNNTGTYVHTIDYSYDLFVRDSEVRANSFDGYISFSDDLSDLYFQRPASLAAEPPIGYTDAGLAHLSNGSGSSSFVQNTKSTLLTGLNIEPGETIYLQWRQADVSGGGSRDEFALDNISLTLTGNPTPNLYTDLYSSNSGFQTANMNTSTQVWSTSPGGGIPLIIAPALETFNYTVQTGNTVVMVTSDQSMKNLTIESGAALEGGGLGGLGTPQYINLEGNIICDGRIGNPGGTASRFGFKLLPGSHAFTGSGTIDAPVIQKTSDPGATAACTLQIGVDVTLHSPNINLLNAQAGNNLGDNNFYVTILPGSVLDCKGSVEMDGSASVTNTTFQFNQGGAIEVRGELFIANGYTARTTNRELPVSLIVKNGGVAHIGYIIAGASNPPNAGFTAGHTLRVESGGLLDITRHTTPPSFSTWQNLATGPSSHNVIDLQAGSTTEYSSSLNQNVPVEVSYHHLLLSGDAQKRIVTTGTLPLTVAGNLDITESTTLNPFGHTINIGEDWFSVAPLSFLSATSTVRFLHSNGPNSISCTNGSQTFYNVEFLNDATNLNCNVIAKNACTIQDRINLNGRELELERPQLLDLGLPNTGYVVSEDNLHAGRIIADINALSVPIRFPFGTSAGVPIYCAVHVQSGNVGTVTMATYPTGADNLPLPTSPVLVNNLMSTTGLSPDNRAATADRFWSITSTGSTFDVNLELGLTTSEDPTVAPYSNTSTLVAQRYDAGPNEWREPLPGQAALLGTNSPSTITITVPGVTEFSPWAVASSESPLPVELLRFAAERSDEGILLDWSTASEVNNSHFEVYRSQDLSSGEELIKRIDGAGNSSSVLTYSCTDTAPQAGWNYYRLVQEDYDGTRHDEGIVSAWWGKEASVLTVEQLYANHDGLSIRLMGVDAQVDVEIIDLSGRIIHQSVEQGSNFTIPLTYAQDGIYIVNLRHRGTLLSERIALIRE